MNHDIAKQLKYSQLYFYSHSSCLSCCVCIVHQALLLIGRWMEETAHYAANRAIQQYKVKWYLYILLNRYLEWKSRKTKLKLFTASLSLEIKSERSEREARWDGGVGFASEASEKNGVSRFALASRSLAILFVRSTIEYGRYEKIEGCEQSIQNIKFTSKSNAPFTPKLKHV